MKRATSNITPGGFVAVGRSAGDEGCWVSIQNEYTYNPATTDRSSIVNVRNSIQIQKPDADVDIDAEITRDECIELAWMFLSVAHLDRNWEGITPPRSTGQDRP